MRTNGNTVLITGGGSGIGLALAKEFIVRQNAVIVCDVNEKRLINAKKEVPGLETIVCDITIALDRERLLATVERDFSKLNIFVNNAAVSLRHNFISPEADLGARAFQEINTNLYGPIELTRMFLPHLLNQKNSALINISSGLAYVPIAQWPVYCATKAGLHSFTQALRYQLKGTSVQLFEVLPSWVDTEMIQDVDTKKISPERVAKEVMRNVGLDHVEIRVGQSGLLFLMSRLAPNYIFKYLNENTKSV